VRYSTKRYDLRHKGPVVAMVTCRFRSCCAIIPRTVFAASATAFSAAFAKLSFEAPQIEQN
jgi:hypothetical protein